MPKLPLTLDTHKLVWGNCKRCELHRWRKKTALYRGSVPCELLFVGEGPGDSEDVLGQPFVGPAGKLLNRSIGISLQAVRERWPAFSPTLGFTNVVACIPKDETLAKIGEPSPESCEACLPRLAEIVQLVQPRTIICVGRVSQRWTRQTVQPPELGWYDIPHPASVLKSPGYLRPTTEAAFHNAVALLFAAYAVILSEEKKNV